MEREVITSLHISFESISKTDETGVYYWLAREIQPLLGYTEWRNFSDVIEKAKLSCKNSGQNVENHFVDVNKMVDIGSGTSREIKDLKLTRYACYLIAQNGDPRKEAIAFAQTYFAVKTRKQEIIEERLKLNDRLQARTKLAETEKSLSSALYEHGVDDKGFSIVRSKGDEALFGGRTTYDMKKRLGIPKTRALADFLPAITLKAKEFAAAITTFNVHKEGLYGVDEVAAEHVKNNSDVRGVLAKNNIKPENLPSEEDIKKLERRVVSEEKKLLKNEDVFSGESKCQN